MWQKWLDSITDYDYVFSGFENNVVIFEKDLPFNEAVREIHANMTCKDVATYSHYVFCRITQKVYFGGHEYTVRDVCEMFPEIPARSIAVRAECGPPGRTGWRQVTLSELMNDWYWKAKTQKNNFIMDRFKDAMRRRGIHEV